MLPSMVTRLLIGKVYVLISIEVQPSAKCFDITLIPVNLIIVGDKRRGSYLWHTLLIPRVLTPWGIMNNLIQWILDGRTNLSLLYVLLSHLTFSTE